MSSLILGRSVILHKGIQVQILPVVEHWHGQSKALGFATSSSTLLFYSLAILKRSTEHNGKGFGL